jgi:chemotaxis protein MotB
MSGAVNRARRPGRSDVGAYWISFSDVMASLLLVFILTVCYSIFQYYSLLETKTRELDAQQSELDITRTALEQRETDLGIANDALLSKEEDLSVMKNRLDLQETELSVSRAALSNDQEKQALLQTQLDEQAITLGMQQDTLNAMESTLNSQKAEMQAQQKRLDDLLGIRTSIIRELSTAFSAANISASVDVKTGDIVLDSTLLFDTGIFILKAGGQEQLSRLIPIYLKVLMLPAYSEYVAEIIIEGHTDSKGSYESNLELSQNRALSVAKFCLELSTLSGDQKALLQSILTAKGRSYSSLIFNPDGTENMDMSRRVEIKFRLKDAEMISEMNKILLNQE